MKDYAVTLVHADVHAYDYSLASGRKGDIDRWIITGCRVNALIDVHMYK